MAIATVDDIAAGLASSSAQQSHNFLKNFGAAKAAGAFQSGWLSAGWPGAGAAPPVYTAGSGYTASSATTGAMRYINALIQNYLARVSFSSTVACTLILADRLWSASGMGFAAGTYAVTTPGSLPARITDGGFGVEPWLENFVAAGAASGTATLTYVNAAGTTGRTGVISAVVSAPVAGQMQPFPYQAGDFGISQVTNVITSATWTSGSFGVTLLKRIVEIPLLLANVAVTLDWAACALKRIPSDACIFPFIHATTTTAPTIQGSINIIDK